VSADQNTAPTPNPEAAMADEKPKEPFLRVVKGDPSDVELAALVTVLAAAGSSDGGPAEAGPVDRWGRPEDYLRPAWGMPTSFVHGR